jgi:hypothetical protein
MGVNQGTRIEFETEFDSSARLQSAEDSLVPDLGRYITLWF